MFSVKMAQNENLEKLFTLSLISLPYVRYSGEKKKKKTILNCIDVPSDNYNKFSLWNCKLFHTFFNGVMVPGPCAHLLFFFFACMFILSWNLFIFLERKKKKSDYLVYLCIICDSSNIYMNVMFLWFTSDRWTHTEGDVKKADFLNKLYCPENDTV